MRVDTELAEEALAIADREPITADEAAYVATARREGRTPVGGDVSDLVRPGLAVAPDAVR